MTHIEEQTAKQTSQHLSHKLKRQRERIVMNMDSSHCYGASHVTLSDAPNVHASLPISSLLATKLLRELTPRPQLMPVLEHDERNQTEKGAEQRQNESCVLTPHIVKECTGEQRRHRTKRVPHKTLARDRRGR